MILDMLVWWYGQGAFQQIQNLTNRLSSVAQTFSITLLLETMFAPFRQIDAGSVQGPINVQFHAWADRTFSRFFGFFIRLFTILSGLIGMLLVLIFGSAWLIFWLAVPLLPLFGLALTLSGFAI